MGCITAVHANGGSPCSVERCVLAGTQLSTLYCCLSKLCTSFVMLQLEQGRLAILEVQRLDISQAGLLRLKLFQKAGNLLLQGLEVRQSTEVSLCLTHLTKRIS